MKITSNTQLEEGDTIWYFSRYLGKWVKGEHIKRDYAVTRDTDRSHEIWAFWEHKTGQALYVNCMKSIVFKDSPAFRVLFLENKNG